MNYKYLSEIGHHHMGEVGTPGIRHFILGALETKLKEAIVDLNNLLTPKQQAVLTGSVQQLLQFHQQQIAKNVDYAAIALARAKVRRLTDWLTRQGAVVDKYGNINWPKSHRTVVYDTDLARQGMTMIRFQGGRMFTDDACQSPLDTRRMVTAVSGPGKAIYVMSATGNIHYSSHSVGHRHHSSLLAGGNVAGAGELEVRNGRLLWLSNKSGHYFPYVPHLLQVLHQLQKKGVPMNFRLKLVPDNKQYATVGEWLDELEMAGKPDYELMKLLRYSHHLTPAVLGPRGWRWQDNEPRGVYQISNGQPVPHKVVRQWLKSQGLLADVEVQSGAGR